MMSLIAPIYNKLRSILLISGIILLLTACAYGLNQKDTKIVDEAELQLRLMGFADRFAAYISQGFEDFDTTSPPLEKRRIVLGDSVYAMYSAFIIAADADPGAALMDMVVMVTLGRIIYEEHYLPKFGLAVEPVVRGFRLAENDIWNIMALVLQPDQQKGLYTLIRQWRQDHPQELQFSFKRFDEFAADRANSKLARIWEPSGLFRSVRTATRQVEKARLLAERTVFLATRVPLLAGYFADMWSSQLLVSPDFKKILADLHRLVNVAEQLPNRVARERKLTIDHAIDRLSAERRATINQMMSRIAIERKNTIDHFLAEEERVKGILTELRQTVTEGNNLIASANAMAEQFNLGSRPEPSEDAKPFDINDFKKTIAEANQMAAQLNSLVMAMDQLLNSPGMEQLLPKLDTTIDRMGDEGEQLIDHTFRQAVLLLAIWFVGYIIAKLTVNYVSNKFSA